MGLFTKSGKWSQILEGDFKACFGTLNRMWLNPHVRFGRVWESNLPILSESSKYPLDNYINQPFDIFAFYF